MFPAQAGMNRQTAYTQVGGLDVPRAGGDEPILRALVGEEN